MIIRIQKTLIVTLLFLLTFFYSALSAQETGNLIIATCPLNYISPSDLMESLLLEKASSEGYELKLKDGMIHIRFNQSNNQVLLSGSENLITEAKELIRFFDVPPRQIVIEVKIVEIDNEKFDRMGLDWQNLLDQASFGVGYNREQIKESQDLHYENPEYEGYSDRNSNDERTLSRISGSLDRITFGEIINILKETHSGKIINIPHIVTTNNKTAKILDGQRITYISRYSSYTNLYETQEMTAGLSLTVTPSIGESGYLTLDVIAKLTSLESSDPSKSRTIDSPVESGQILENIVIAKDREPILLGGFKQTETVRVRRKFPILGTILPFLFSKHVNVEVTKNILLILTPKIIDLNTTEIPEF